MKLLTGCCVSKWVAVRAGSESITCLLIGHPAANRCCPGCRGRAPRRGTRLLGRAQENSWHISQLLWKAALCVCYHLVWEVEVGLCGIQNQMMSWSSALTAIVNWDLYLSKSKEGLLALFWDFGTCYQNIYSAIAWILSLWKWEIKAYLFLYVNALPLRPPPPKKKQPQKKVCFVNPVCFAPQSECLWSAAEEGAHTCRLSW